MASLNPVKSIGDHLCEAIRLHRRVSRRQARLRARELLEAVGIARADRRMREYAHQFSGGMCQRVMIAMALVNDPALIIADEPTTALDVTTQAQILALLQSLQADFGSAVILVTHDFGVIAETVDDVMIMYAGNVVERGSVKSVFRRPRHPYTWGLIGSIPRSDVTVQRLHQIPGQPPSPLHAPPGCRFHPRCPHAMPICRVDVPELRPSPGEAAHYDACHLADEVKAEEGASLRARLSRRTK